VKIRARGLSFSYGRTAVLRNATAHFHENRITAIVGPSGCGKTTFLSTLNRLWEETPGGSMRGTVEIRLDGSFRDIYARELPVENLRRRVGTVFQTPNPLPMSVFRNVSFPLRLAGVRDPERIRHETERALRRAHLWEEVRHRLSDSALSLSGGQQQRLCIARALILEPEVLLLDEPTSSLDPEAMDAVESLLIELKESCTLLVVSHYLNQVRRIADRVVSLKDGVFAVDSAQAEG